MKVVVLFALYYLLMIVSAKEKNIVISIDNTDNAEQLADQFSKTVLNLIDNNLTSFRLNDEYHIFKYKSRLFSGTIYLYNGTSSNLNYRFLNSTVSNYTGNQHLFKTYVQFDPIMLTYENCTLNFMGTTQYGALSAYVEQLIGEYQTIIPFGDKEISPVLREYYYTTYKSLTLSFNRNSTDLFDVLGLLAGDRLNVPFVRQLDNMFKTVIYDNVANIYDNYEFSYNNSS